MQMKNLLIFWWKGTLWWYRYFLFANEIKKCFFFNSPPQVLVLTQHHPSAPRPPQPLTPLTSVRWSPSSCRVGVCPPAVAVVAAASLSWAVCPLSCLNSSRPHRCTSLSLQQVREGTWHSPVKLAALKWLEWKHFHPTMYLILDLNLNYPFFPVDLIV